MVQSQSRAPGEKVALITGTSGGIGLAAGVALIRAGYRVFGTTRQAKAGEVRQGIHMLRCDVTDDESVKLLVKDVIGLAGRIDVLVNNAGRSLIGAAEESSIDQAQSLFDINVFGILRTTKEVLPIMRKQRSGRIINISSVAGFLPGPYTALYNATKHAVEGYSESLDHELRTFGIRVSLIEPVFTRTGLGDHGDQPDQILSVYDKGRAAANTTWRNGVAEKVVKAATDKEPTLRYTPGKMAGRLRLMRRFIPEKAFDKSFRKQMGVAD
ncbi:oxidoreductase [Mesorhizobium sp. AaZ16]|uniref:oxidoreductase n=1 Tax=Mesorhizobium sp. AaZ16 TaxID=3402289 RepID=UPI00374F95E6